MSLLFLELEVIYIWALLISKENHINKSFQNEQQMLIGKMHNLFFQQYQILKEIEKDSYMIYKSLLNNIGKYFIFFNTLFFQTSIMNEQNQNCGDDSSVFGDIQSISLSINDDTIITIYEGNPESVNQDIILIIRNYQGKFLWKGELVYQLIQNEDNSVINKKESFKESEHADNNFEIINDNQYKLLLQDL